MTRKRITLQQLKNIASIQREGFTRPRSVSFSIEQDKFDRVKLVNNKTKEILEKI